MTEVVSGVVKVMDETGDTPYPYSSDNPESIQKIRHLLDTHRAEGRGMFLYPGDQIEDEEGVRLPKNFDPATMGGHIVITPAIAGG